VRSGCHPQRGADSRARYAARAEAALGRRSARVLLDDRQEREVALDSSADAALLAR
jgi:hypothetical protein